MSPGEVVPLTDEHHEQAVRLGRLAFGGDLGADVPPPPAGPASRDAWGVLDDRGRLVAKAVLLDHEQWWGGRRVRTGGVAGVAVHPDARGSGVATRLLHALTGVMRDRGQGVSALFPTLVGLYRGLGWEVVGHLDETRLPTRSLADVVPSAGSTDVRPSAGSADVRVRTAGPDDAPALLAVYDRWAREQAGALVREGRAFPDAATDALDADVVALAEGPDGTPLGYVAYDRGAGYRESAELHSWELVSTDRAATEALVASVGRWHPVAPSTLWRGPTAELGLLLPVAVPPPATRQPWMLRVVDPAAAVAARGWAADVALTVTLVGADLGERTWRLTVQDGRGVLEPASGPAPRLHTRGLALLHAGACDTSAVRRAGLLDGDLPGLDAALAGPPPVLLDYF